MSIRMKDTTVYLSHHGIKGQKWGVRRTPEQLGHVSGTGNAQQGSKSGEGKSVSTEGQKKVRDAIHERVVQLRKPDSTTEEIAKYRQESQRYGKMAMDLARQMGEYERKKSSNPFWSAKRDRKYLDMREERDVASTISKKYSDKCDDAILSEVISSFKLDDSKEMRTFLKDIIDQGDREASRRAYGDDDGND